MKGMLISSLTTYVAGHVYEYLVTSPKGSRYLIIVMSHEHSGVSDQWQPDWLVNSLFRLPTHSTLPTLNMGIYQSKGMRKAAPCYGVIMGFHYNTDPHHHHDPFYDPTHFVRHKKTKTVVWCPLLDLLIWYNTTMFNSLQLIWRSGPADVIYRDWFMMNSNESTSMGYGLSQWEKALLCNAFSHWVSPYLSSGTSSGHQVDEWCCVLWHVVT